MPVSRSGRTLPVPCSRPGCRPIWRPPSPLPRTIASRHSTHVGERRHLGDGHAPVLADGVEMLHRPAPAALAVELDQPVHQRLPRHELQLRVERGADREAALVERLLAEHLGELAPDLLGEIVGREQVRQRRAAASRRAARPWPRRLLPGSRSRSRPCGRSPSCGARWRAPGSGTDGSCSAPSAAPRDRRPRRSVSSCTDLSK